LPERVPLIRVTEVPTDTNGVFSGWLMASFKELVA